MATRMTTNFNVRNNIFASITPPPWVQNTNLDNPQGEWKPASWLPILFSKSDRNQGTDYFTISVGKVVALDVESNVVPAGLRGAWAKAGATTVLTYTATDYEQGIVNLTTGQRYAVNGTTSYTALQVAKALVERGLVASDVASANPPSSDADIEAVVQAFISEPVGVMLYDVYAYTGDAATNSTYFTNYQKQHLVQFTNRHQMKVPWRVSDSTDADSFDVSVVTITSAVSGAGDFPQAGEVWDIDALVDLARYDLEGDEEIVALALAESPVAKNTSRTPFACDVDGVLLVEKTSVLAIKKAGDWFLDTQVGLLFLHADTYDTLVTDNTDPTFSYSFYDNAAVGATSAQWIFFDGEGKPGDHLSVDEQSNFIVKGSAEDFLDATSPSIGRIMYVYKEPRQLMDKVKSAWSLSNMPKTAKMPGSATAGYSDMITLPDETIADSIVVITVRF